MSFLNVKQAEPVGKQRASGLKPLPKAGLFALCFLLVSFTSYTLFGVLEVPYPITPIPQLHSVASYQTYTVKFDPNLHINTVSAEKAIVAAYSSPKGWQQTGVTFHFTNVNPKLTIWFTTGSHITSLSPICDSYYNCTVGNTIYVNASRWLYGDGWPGKVADYHTLIINHETGHYLGLDEWGCLCAFRSAPVMLTHQNVTTWHLWKPNPWPISEEIATVKKEVIGR